MYSNIWNPLPECADKPAFCDENRVFTFGELLKAAQGLGTHLAKTVDTLHKPVAVLIGRTASVPRCRAC